MSSLRFLFLFAHQFVHINFQTPSGIYFMQQQALVHNCFSVLYLSVLSLLPDTCNSPSFLLLFCLSWVINITDGNACGASPVAQLLKNPTVNAEVTRGMSLIPWSGRSPGKGNGNPLQYSCLGNPMDRGAWQATVHGVTKSRTPLSDWTTTKKCFVAHLLLGCSFLLPSLATLCHYRKPARSTWVFPRASKLLCAI